MSLLVLPPLSSSPSPLSTPSVGPGPAGGAPAGQDGSRQLLQQIDQLLQELLQSFGATPDDGTDGAASGADDPSSGAGQDPGGDAGWGGIDPQLAQMLAHVARMFEAMMQQQRPASPDDAEGVPGVGGKAAPSKAVAGGGDAPAGDAGPAAVPSRDAPAMPAAAKTDGVPGEGMSNNAGGVPQAGAVSGVAPGAVQVLQTGTGSDKTYNVTNATDKPESFTYSTRGENKGTLTLQPGETGAFVAGSGDLGVRISPSDAQGNTHPDEVLYEDGGADNGQGTGAGNPDISKVDGDKDFAGRAMKMTVTLSDGKTAGDGDAIRPYLYSTDDAAAMGLAGDPSKTANIVMSNG